MSDYVLVLLVKGPNWKPDNSWRMWVLQMRHMANLWRLRRAGKVVLAGPFADNGDVRGIAVLKVGSPEEARRLMETDPAFKAGRLRFEYLPLDAPSGE